MAARGHPSNLVFDKIAAKASPDRVKEAICQNFPRGRIQDGMEITSRIAINTNARNNRAQDTLSRSIDIIVIETV